MCELFARPHKDAALAEQPKRAQRGLLLARHIGQEAPNQRCRSAEERSRLLGHKFPKGWARLELLPVEDSQILAEFVAPRQRAKLPAHKAPQRRFARQR